MQSSNRQILLILLTYLGMATLYAQLTPAWQAPDEPAHYNYVRQLAEGELPVMELDDYNQAYQSEVISSRFDPQYSIDPFTYEDYQPPLYYLLQTPVFWLTGGDLFVMRQVGVALGGITLILAFFAFTQVEEIIRQRKSPAPVAQTALKMHSPAPRVPPLALLATLFFAFLPQHVAMQASVNNDSLGELLVAAMLVWLLAAIRREQDPPLVSLWYHHPSFLGLLLGLAFLTKVTAYLMAPVIALYLLWRRWGEWGRLLQGGILIFGPALLLGSFWWLRNLGVYGWPDALGTFAHDAAVVGQPTTATWVAQFGSWETVRRFFQTTFRSFWGQFGWMGVVMDRWLYRFLGLFSAAVAAGAVVLSIRQRRIWPVLRPLLIIFLTLAGLNVLLLVVYNFTYVQHQGRYLFSSLIPLSLLVPAGVWGWLALAPISASQQGRINAWLTIAFGVGMVLLDLVALFWFILPQLS